jgi:4-hydroxythreonine-4-phosphate dehydrogenase
MTLPLALTMGEPAGIGGDIALAAWLERGRRALPPFFVIDDAGRLADLAQRLGLPVPIRPIAQPTAAAGLFAEALPVLDRPLPAAVEPGRPDPAAATRVVSAIEEAVRLVMAGQAAAVVTNPIHKRTLYQAGFRFAGHTEFLADLAGAAKVVMMLASNELKVVPVTVHLALAAAIQALTSDEIVAAGRITAAALRRDFAIARPRLAVAGLNPHAGEEGTMGREDIDVVAPAVQALQRDGIDAIGPLAADSMFHATARARYDAALCMYHDQALIPLKTIDFDGGVNVTLGLPFVRTSPDHGTAFDLAGSGKARPDSLIAAIRLAGQIAARRG